MSAVSPQSAARWIAGLALLALIAWGHDARRLAQLSVLALPLLVWLLWPVQTAWLHRVRLFLVWAWAMAFALDGALRGYLQDAYHAAPDSALVLGAVANTNGREAGEYLSTHWRSVLGRVAVLAAAGLVLWHGAAHGARGPERRPRRRVAWLALALLLGSSVAYLSKPWRRLHPAVFWASWQHSVQTLRAGWSDQQAQRERALAHAKAAAPAVAHDDPATLVLVVAESINRDNMSLYGYGRDTTPRLLAQKAELGDRMLVLRNAWSVDASTLPSLRNIFGFGRHAAGPPLHLLALARAAGYKVWWLSNHDDIAIEQQHARLADQTRFLNRVPGRSGASLDGQLLGSLAQALEDRARRKLVVVHLLGAHPRYSLRFPAGANPFAGRSDEVDEAMKKNGRSAWVRSLRKDYDAALRYHDLVVSQTLQLARQAGRTGGRRAWMYLSDHGQEVGHVGDHAGHSPATAAGYRIPMMVWRNAAAAAPPSPGMAHRPFRADWAGWTLADLLGIRWDGRIPERNVLHPGYRWQAPVLPLAVEWTEPQAELTGSGGRLSAGRTASEAEARGL